MRYINKRFCGMESQNLQLSVSEFIDLTNQVLEGAYPAVAVVGEVASFSVNQGKFVFFDLKDDTGTVGCFMMVYQLRVPIEDGMRVVVTGAPKLTARGRFSITVRSVRPVGEGSLKKSFELLRAKLDAEGLFDPERKRALPAMPARVAVISSTQAAGYADFVEVLGQRWGNVALTVAHTAVQGEGAADQIIRAIEYFNQSAEPAEVLVIVRGGGSADDLAVFNDERLVRAVAGSRVPTLVGIGHEVDTSLVDLAADVRAATPTHAAQLLVPDREAVIDTLRAKVRHGAVRSIGDIDAMIEADRRWLSRAIESAEQRLENSLTDLGHLVSTIRAYDPQSILARGYAIIRGEHSTGAMIQIETHDEQLTAEVRSVSKK